MAPTLSGMPPPWAGPPAKGLAATSKTGLAPPKPPPKRGFAPPRPPPKKGFALPRPSPRAGAPPQIVAAAASQQSVGAAQERIVAHGRCVKSRTRAAHSCIGWAETDGRVCACVFVLVRQYRASGWAARENSQVKRGTVHKTQGSPGAQLHVSSPSMTLRKNGATCGRLKTWLHTHLCR